MKTVKMRSSIMASVAALLFSFSALQKGSITDITKPYLGTYECERADLGSGDLLARFDDLRLELKDKGEYVLYYKEKGAKIKKINGKYHYDEQSKTISLYLPNSRHIHREFPLSKGVLTITVPYGEKTLRLTFAQK